MDEACFMWGSYVQGEIDKATKGTKTDKEAERKVKLVLRKLLKEDEEQYRRNAAQDADGVEQELPPVSGKNFRDPASVIRTG